MSLLDSVAIGLFVSFPVYPLIYLGRLLFRARTRAPLLLITFHLQAISFVALTAWFTWMARPVLSPLAGSGLAGSLPLPTLFFIMMSTLLRTAPGALLALAAAGLVLRLTGKRLSARWRDRTVPVWRIDAAALMLWGLMSAALALQLLSLMVPLVATLD